MKYILFVFLVVVVSGCVSCPPLMYANTIQEVESAKLLVKQADDKVIVGSLTIPEIESVLELTEGIEDARSQTHFSFYQILCLLTFRPVLSPSYVTEKGPIMLEIVCSEKAMFSKEMVYFSKDFLVLNARAPDKRKQKLANFVKQIVNRITSRPPNKTPNN